MRTAGMGLVGTIVVLVGQAVAQGPPPTSPARIVAGPDVLVSLDGEVPHVEGMIAANPKNPRNLVAAAIVGGRPGGGYHCKTYASADAGSSWVDRTIPEQARVGGGDPQVAFTPRGTALFTCLAFVKDDRNRTRAALHVYRSEDGGLGWTGPIDLGVSYDHEMLAVDRTPTRFAGRAYLAALYGRNYTLGLFRSDDDGRTWTGPVEITNGGDHGVNVTNLVVFADGELLATWIDFPVTPTQETSWKGTHLWTAVSKDGGITFSAPRRGPALGPHWSRRHPDIRLHSDPSYGASVVEGERDRVYLALTRFTETGSRVMFTRSDDRGATWSEPTAVAASSPAAAKQFMPRLAVNRAGTVGIAFSDTRGLAEGLAWHEYFTASIDGGASFLTPVQVSTEPSRPGGVGNERLEPLVFTDPDGGVQVSLISSGGRWTNGGDYLGLAVDSTDAFHPLWADARTGTFQMWTARIRVDRPPRPPRPSPIDALFPPERPPPPLTAPTEGPIDVTSRVEMVFDPTRYDPVKGELELRVRLRNVSTDSIFAALVLEVKEFTGPPGEPTERPPTILNATNGATGAGATFDFSKLVGADRVIAPGAQTAASLWRLKIADPRRTPSLKVLVTGVVRGARR